MVIGLVLASIIRNMPDSAWPWVAPPSIPVVNAVELFADENVKVDAVVDV